MRPTRSGHRMATLVMTALAVMTLCFAQRSTGSASLPALPHNPPAAAQADQAQLVDVNTAGLDELMTLPGIGQARAQAILDDRAANGSYRYPENLIRVKGIGEGVLGQILDQITAGGEGDAQDSGG